jgi:hypothetical protein
VKKQNSPANTNSRPKENNNKKKKQEPISQNKTMNKQP